MFFWNKCHMTTNSSRNIKCKSMSNKPIFEAYFHFRHQKLRRISLEEVRDAYESFEDLKVKDKDDYYNSVGLDGKMVREYLIVVENLEKSFKKIY